MRLPSEILMLYGDLSEYIYEKYPDGPYPHGYAGIYRNASGGITLMLVQPTMERIQEIRRNSGAEFWVLSADYDWNTLLAIQDILVGMMEGSYGIHAVYPSVDGNCVVVSVDDDSAGIRSAIYDLIEQNGFDPKAVVIRKEARASAFF